MQNNTLRDKLEQKVYQNKPEVIEESNIVPFEKNDQKIVSVVPEFAITIADAKERIKMLQEFVKEMMVENVDYGIIPHCDKPSLFKPGAEKLTDIFGFSKQVEVINRLEDWKEGIFHYEVKAILRSKRTGLIEAEGIGCANSREKKFSTQHSYSLINTILKMAKKRALVDAVLSATRSSSLFTQDIEDIDPDMGMPSNKNVYAPKNETRSNGQQPARQSYDNARQVTKNQLNKIHSIVEQKSIPVNRVKAHITDRYHVNESKNLTIKQADDFIKFLLNY